MTTEASFSTLPEPKPGADLNANPEQKPASPTLQSPSSGQHLAPGDQAAPGTPGTGEDACRDCGGKGIDDAGVPCPNCEGTGKVIVGIGGA